MAGWHRHRGQIVQVPLDNIDTDQLIPARFMSAPRAAGYGDYLMHDLRRTDSGALDADFPLNRHSGASVLVAGRNFGSGSSREAAVYALLDAGFRVVMAPSFGDIFSSNAINNGLLPARVTQVQIDAMPLQDGPCEAEVSLEKREIVIAGQVTPFALDETWRTKLIKGWDDIDLTLQHHSEIAQYRTRIASEPGRWPLPQSLRHRPDR